MRAANGPTSTTTSTTTTKAPEKPQDAATAEDKAEPQAVTFHVLKAITLDDGLTVMPGETFNPSDVKNWPARRTQQLVDQKFLRPIK